MGVQTAAASVHAVVLVVGHQGMFMWCPIWSRCLHLLLALRDDLLLGYQSLSHPWSPSQTLVVRGSILLILVWHHSLQSNTLLSNTLIGRVDFYTGFFTSFGLLANYRLVVELLWCIESRATNHVTKDAGIFTSYFVYLGTNKLHIRSGMGLDI